MKTKIELWKVEDLASELNNIQEQPKYQRGAVWKLTKKQMLIDSMLRGVDVPKIYLRKLDRGLFKYEVADGQQRLIAIRDFINKKLKLSDKTVNGLDLSRIGHYTVGNKNIDEINTDLKKAFLKYELTVAVVDDSSNSEIRVLFSRLQMGDTLNPAEKRNAIISQLGTEVDNIALNHDFFKNCKIGQERYKRQDYITHIFALIYYKNKYDLKAPLFHKMYFDLYRDVPQNIINDIVRILDWMCEIDGVSKRRIVNKWSFVDIFYILYVNKGKISRVDHKEFAIRFTEFERIRLLKSNQPENLITGRSPSQQEQELYAYITAFKANGGNPQNITKRLNAFQSVFGTALTFK